MVMGNDNQERLFERILCSVNHDVRAAMLLTGALGTPDTATQIRKNLISFLGNSTLLPGDASFINYCTILETYGFAESSIATNRATTQEVTHWGITQDGVRYAVPAAALSIRASNLFGVSTYHLLGKTGTPPRSKSRAAFNAGRIFKTLYYEGKIGEREFAELLGMYQSDVRGQCVKFSDLGFVERTFGVYNYRGLTGKKAFDMLTVSGEELTEQLILPIWIVSGDRHYRSKEYRTALTEYSNKGKMRKEIINSLTMLYQKKK